MNADPVLFFKSAFIGGHKFFAAWNPSCYAAQPLARRLSPGRNMAQVLPNLANFNSFNLLFLG
jgi:hypothetical protein